MKRQLGVVFAVVFVDLLGFGIVLPLLPTYAATFDVSPTAIGFLVTSFSLLQLLAVPVWGALSDRYGRRPVLIVGLLGSTASYVLFALAGSYWALLLSRVVAGAMGATIGVAQAYIADVTAPERRAHVADYFTTVLPGCPCRNPQTAAASVAAPSEKATGTPGIGSAKPIGIARYTAPIAISSTGLVCPRGERCIARGEDSMRTIRHRQRILPRPGEGAVAHRLFTTHRGLALYLLPIRA